MATAAVQEARAAIEQYEAATAPTSVDALTARLLAARVREVVQDNQTRE